MEQVNTIQKDSKQVNMIPPDSKVSATFGKGFKVLATNGIIPEQKNTTPSTFSTSGYSSLSSRPLTANKHSDLIKVWDSIRHSSLQNIWNEAMQLKLQGNTLIHLTLVGYHEGEFYPTIRVDLNTVEVS